MADDKVYDMHEIHCGNCRRYIGTLKIRVNPSKLVYEDAGASRDITLADLENLKCSKCGRYTDLTIEIGRKTGGQA